MKLSIVLSAQPTHFAAATFQGELARNLAHIATLGYDGVELAIREPAVLDSDAVVALLDDQKSVMVGMVDGEIDHCTFNKAIKLHKTVSMDKLELAEILSI